MNAMLIFVELNTKVEYSHFSEFILLTVRYEIEPCTANLYEDVTHMKCSYLKWLYACSSCHFFSPFFHKP